MPAAVDIVLDDAQATPVSHTFVPIGPDANGTMWLEDQSASSAVGFNRLSVQVIRASNPQPGANAQNRISRVKIGIHTPKLETLGNNSAGLLPPPTVAYIPRVNIEFIIPERSSLLDRKDLRKYADYLMANAQVIAAVEGLQTLY